MKSKSKDISTPASGSCESNFTVEIETKKYGNNQFALYYSKTTKYLAKHKAASDEAFGKAPRSSGSPSKSSTKSRHCDDTATALRNAAERL